MTLPLTPKQERVWRYILSCERSPTYDEIAQHIGARSRTTAFRAVAALRKRGFIKRRPRLARTITPAKLDLASAETSDLIAELERRGVVLRAFALDVKRSCESKS